MNNIVKYGAFAVVILSLISIVSVTSECSVSNNDLLTAKYLNVGNIDDSLTKAITDSVDVILDLVSKNPNNQKSDINSTMKLDTKNGIKRYGILKNNDLTEQLRYAKFKDFISEEYAVEFPVVDAKGNVITVASYFYIKTADKYKSEKLAFPDPQMELGFWNYVNTYSDTWTLGMINNSIYPSDFQKIIAVDELIIEINEQGYAPEEIRYISLNQYNTHIVYFEYRDNEYAMPYSLRPDLTGVKNGSVYAVTELVNQLNTVFD